MEKRVCWPRSTKINYNEQNMNFNNVHSEEKALMLRGEEGNKILPGDSLHALFPPLKAMKIMCSILHA